ncbi:MAG: hypothetical protein P8176_16030, partial [Gammaproteobacteria bacterium]
PVREIKTESAIGAVLDVTVTSLTSADSLPPHDAINPRTAPKSIALDSSEYILFCISLINY